MSVEIGGIRVRIGFTAAAFLACLVNSGRLSLILMGGCAVCLHELTHLILMIVFGCRDPTVDIFPGGVRIRSPEFDAMGYLPTVICLLSAPLANLLLAFLLMIACRFIKSEIIL